MTTSKTRRVTDSLPCRLSDNERLDFADALAEANQAVDNAEQAKASAIKQYNYDIGLAKARRDRISGIVASKTEYREVVVEEKWDWEKDRYSRTRTDTGEVVFERRLTDKEKQTQIVDDENE